MSFATYFTEATNPEVPETNIKFIEKRKAGAAKIAKQATVKGGYSALTAAHFHAKQKPYANCLKKAENFESIKKQVDNLVDKIQSWETMSQMEFQKVMGQLEAYGEVALQLKKPKEY